MGLFNDYSLSLSLITTKWRKLVFVWVKKTSNRESEMERRGEREKIILKKLYTYICYIYIIYAYIDN
jgi:hypothetical protein